ncbi:MAG TPA: alpha/beta hydrolase-fold protein [Tepidisphaeraceae bacterium]|nr:alpha/beta hydrolase-fold protein [Tepidisphaeraceae bacterium]
MKTRLFSVALLLLLTGGPTWAQTTQPVEDFKPSALNQGGRQYPQVNSEGRARFRIAAPQAKTVRSSFSGPTQAVKGEDGAWIITTRPLDEGFHYYSINIDGADVPDPGTLFFYGAGRWGSAIEVPAKDRDFYQLKDVPHGQLRQDLYFSKSTNAMRRCFVYTPPDYDKDPSRRYPVLYLQHGAGEDETGWGNQGHAGLIMDNLLAQGKCKPYIIVMDNGGGIGGGPRRGRPPGRPQPAAATAPAAGRRPANPGRPGGFAFNFGGFEHILIDELIPHIDSAYRTIADQPHRAMAGLSMGGMQTRMIGLAHLDTFSQLGIFSGGSIAPSDVSDMPAFKQKVKLVFVSYGSREVDPANRRRGGPFGGDPKASTDALKQAGINTHYYISPQTAHEWQSWRRSLHEFAPLLFQE